VKMDYVPFLRKCVGSPEASYSYSCWLNLLDVALWCFLTYIYRYTHMYIYIYTYIYM
jgi:hypothetical protein